MSYLFNNQQKLNEIIFADRNKAYGAYVLRSEYGNTIVKSLSLMMLGVASIMAVAFVMNRGQSPGPDLSGQVVIQDSFIVVPFGDDKKPDIEKPDKPADHKTILPDDPASDNPFKRIVDSTFEVTQTQTATSTSQNTTATEPSGTTGGNLATTGDVGRGGSSLGIDTSTTPKQPFELDSNPEFEGGLSALYRFVGQHLKYPNWASAEGREGTVYVKFVVDENGKVSNLRLLNSIGYGMDDEALRVVSLIPKFKTPAKVNGQSVKAYFQIPIRFRFKY